MPSMLPGRDWRFCRDPFCSGGAHRRNFPLAILPFFKRNRCCTYKIYNSTPGSQNLALERRHGPNLSERNIEIPTGAHMMAAEDKCASTWAYLSSYIYPKPLRESQKSRNLPRSRRPPGTKTFLLRVKPLSKPWSKR